MLNAVMLVRDRYTLTAQAISTFLNNSALDWTLTIIDDGSFFQTKCLLDRYRATDGVAVLRADKPVGVTGRMRNLGVYWSERMFGRGDYLYLSDNDAYFTKSWDVHLVEALEEHGEFLLLGPYRHPYHLPNRQVENVVATDAVQGLGHLMRWDTWDKYGPLDAHAPGTNQSEDFAFCQKIVKDGYLVGSIQPDVVYNCGLTGTSGAPSPGAEVMARIAGVFME